MARRKPPADHLPPPPPSTQPPRTRSPEPAAGSRHAGASGEPPQWPPIRPASRSGPRRDRRKPLRPRQVILAVLTALGLGALLSSGALVGLAERQPIGTQRDVALGAANSTDRLAHALSLNRPAERLAAAFDGEEEFYDVEALIARARATAPRVPPPSPEPDEDTEGDPTIGDVESPTVPEVEDPATAAEQAEPDEEDAESGPAPDGLITPILDIDCVRAEPTEAQPDSDGTESNAGPEGGNGASGPDGATEAPASSDGSSPEPDSGEAANGNSPVGTSAAPGSEDPAPDADVGRTPGSAGSLEDRRLAAGSRGTDDADDPDNTDDTDGAEATDEAGEEPPGGEPDGADTAGGSGATSGDDGTGSEGPTPGECPPGYAPAGDGDATAEPPGGTDPADGPPDERPAQETVTFDAPRTPSEDSRLALYVGGDSISRDLGEGLARITPADLVRIDLDPRPATGLSRPDFFDWSQHLAGVLTESSPDVFVVMFGANDFQNVEYEGEILDRFGNEWLELYRERVDRIMTLLSQPGTQTVWVGQPPVRESRLSSGLSMLNEVYAERAAAHPQVTFVNTWDHFGDDEGGYTDEIGGVRMRREDGVHLTIAGGNHLAEAIWRVIAAAWGLE